MKTLLFAGVSLFLSTFSALAFECKVIALELGNRRYYRNQVDLHKGTPRTVQLVYFAPSDISFNSEVVEDIQREIQNVRVYYGQQMEKNGHGWTTFRVETDEQGVPKVHKVKGKHPEFYYHENGMYGGVLRELELKFDIYSNIYLVVIELIKWNAIDGAGGVGGRFGKTGGMALVPGEQGLMIGDGDIGRTNQRKKWRGTITHELGHVFGLEHNFHDSTYMMAYGNHTQMSECSADYLSVHPFLNLDVPAQEGVTLPAIQLLSSPSYPEMAQSAKLEIRTSSLHGIHQVTLFSQTPVKHPAYPAFELKECQNALGYGVSTVTFDYDGVIPSVPATRLADSVVHYIKVRAVALNGDVNEVFFHLVERSPHHIAVLNSKTSVREIAFSSDSKKLVVSSEDGVSLWDVDSLQNIGMPEIDRPLPYHNWDREVQSRSAAFSPNNMIFATSDIIGEENKIQLWDATTLKLIKNFGEYPNTWGITSMVFSPDGQSIITGGSNVVKVWDIGTERNIVTFRHTADANVDPNDYPTGTVVHSPDGRIVASTDGITNDRVYLWDSVTGNVISIVDLLGLGIGALDFSPDGRILAIGGSTLNSIRGLVPEIDLLQLRDVETGDVVFGSHMETRYVESIDFFPDGSALVIGASESKVKMLDLRTKRLVHTFGSSGYIQDAEISPDGNILACAAWQRTIELWDVSWWMNQSHINEDVNSDGVVDILDLVIISTELNIKGGSTKGDINGDGVVDIRDLVLVANAME